MSQHLFNSTNTAGKCTNIWLEISNICPDISLKNINSKCPNVALNIWFSRYMPGWRCRSVLLKISSFVVTNVQMFIRPVPLNIMSKTCGSVFINTARNVHRSRQKFSWKMSHLNQVCCLKCSSSLSKISEYFTTNTAGKCLDVSSKTSSGFRLMNVETLSEQWSLACHASRPHQPVDI